MKILMIDSNESYLTTKSNWVKISFAGKHKIEIFKIAGKYLENANINIEAGMNIINMVNPGLIIIDVNTPVDLILSERSVKKDSKV